MSLDNRGRALSAGGTDDERSAEEDLVWARGMGIGAVDGRASDCSMDLKSGFGLLAILGVGRMKAIDWSFLNEDTRVI